MHRHARRSGAVVVLLFVAACGSSKHAAPSSGSGARSSTTLAGSPDPNAGDQLPPGDIPDNQVFVTYTSSDGYSLSYPEGWAKRGIAGATRFSQNFNSIEVETTQSTTAPTIASTRAAASSTLGALPGYKLIKIDSVGRSAGTAIRVVYDATSAVDAVTGKTVTLEVERYLFWHKGTLLTIALSSAKGSDNVDPWKTVTDSLVWK